MSNVPNDAAVSRAVSAARNYLSAEDAAKIEKIAKNKEALQGLTSSLSNRDWANVMRVVNDPDLLRKILSSPQGKSVLHDLLKKIP